MVKRIQTISKFIAFTISIFLLLYLMTKEGKVIFKDLRPQNIDFWTFIVCLLNLIVLIVFFFLFQKEHVLEFKSKDAVDRYSSLLHVMSNGQVDGNDRAKWYNERVNKLVKQLNTNLIWYAIFLMPVYTLFIFDTDKHPYYHYFCKIAEDIFNYLSSLFIYFAFLVLYNNTLDNKDNTSSYLRNRYFIVSILFSFGYFILYALYAEPGIANSNDVISNRFSLVAGMINALVMILLFARYISMEHVIKDIKHIGYSPIVTVGIIYLLPLYAVVQPLFGSFHMSAYGRPAVFANSVFAVCLLGKSFFLYATWLFMKKKLMHLYLHLTITPHDVPQGYENCFLLH